MARSRLMRITVFADDTTTDWRQEGSFTALNNKGAGDAPFLLGGWSPEAAHPYNGITRSYAHFPLTSKINEVFPSDSAHPGWGGVKRIRLAYFTFSTRQIDPPAGTPSYPYNASYFDVGSDAKVRVHRLTRDAVYNSNGDGKIDNPSSPPPSGRWSSSDDSTITGDDMSDAHYDEFVSPNDKGETRVIATPLVGLWVPGTAGGHKIDYFNNKAGANYVQCGDPDDHTAMTNHGVALRASSEQRSGGDTRWEFYSSRASVANRYLPQLVLIVEPFGAKPFAPRLIEPTDEVAPDYWFEGYLDEDPADPVVSVELMVNNDYDGGGQTIWNPTVLRSGAWPDGKFRIATPLTPQLAKDHPYSWGARTRTANATASDWRRWRDFTIRRVRPTVTPQAVGSQVKLVGARLRASFTTP